MSLSLHKTKDRRVLYLVQAHHSKPKPVYSHLLPHSINLGDKHWFTLARKAGKLKATESFLVQLPGQARCWKPFDFCFKGCLQ